MPDFMPGFLESVKVEKVKKVVLLSLRIQRE